MGIQSGAIARLRTFGAALAVLAACATTLVAQQESGRITGHVTDASNQAPIPAAQIIVTGTTIGQNTTDSGTFSLRVPADGKSFTVRRIGYLAQTVPIAAGKTEYTVTLQKDVLRLETQVVTGVATTVAAQNAANAVSVVSTQDVNQVPAPTIENSLEGKVPGAIIQNLNGGAPGGGVQVQVRGITSINANAEPLYVIDGVVLNNQTVNEDQNAISRAGGGQSTTGQAVAGAPSVEDNGVNRIADINPDDIESVEVLKGASASAIYGSKASAGVVIITTKKGTTGKARWDISGQVGHYSLRNEYPIRTFPTLASAQSWYLNDLRHVSPDSTATVAADNAQVASIYGGPQDFQSQLFGNGQASYQTNVSVGGTSGQTQYYLSGLSKYDNGIMLNTGYNKQSVRANITQQFAAPVTVSANLNYIHDNTRRGISGNDNIGVSPYNVLSTLPQFINADKLNPDGSWPVIPFGIGPANPFADAAEINTPQELSRFIGGGNVTWMMFHTEHQDLRINALGGADLSSLHDLLYAPPSLQVEQAVPSGLPGTSVSNVSQINYFNYSLNLIHHYTGLSWLDATSSVGFVRERRSLSNPVMIGYNLLTGVNSPTAGTVLQAYYNQTEQLDQSVYVQEQALMLDSKLSLTLGVTGERSTIDGDINKFYYYPHYAGSYRLPTFAFLNELKVRAAYGQAGNLAPYGAKYTPFLTSVIDGGNATAVNSQLGQSSIKPESSQETEFGIDATMFHSRAQFTASVYQKRLSNLLLQAGVAPSHGYSTLFENGGEFTNQGLELSLQATPFEFRNGLNWNTSVSFFRNYSVSNALPTPPFTAGRNFGYGADLLAPGRSLTEIIDPNFTGPSGLNVQVGDFSYGYLVSWQNEVTFKGFRLAGLLDWARGGNTINLTDQYFDTGPHLGTDSLTAVANNAGTAIGREMYVQPAGFLKLREVTLSYNLPASLISRVGGGRFSSARLSLAGYNLAAIFNYHGVDPEVSAFGNQAIGRGYDVTPYPPARSYFLGLDLGL